MAAESKDRKSSKDKCFMQAQGWFGGCQKFLNNFFVILGMSLGCVHEADP